MDPAEITRRSDAGWILLPVRFGDPAWWAVGMGVARARRQSRRGQPRKLASSNTLRICSTNVNDGGRQRLKDESMHVVRTVACTD